MNKKFILGIALVAALCVGGYFLFYNSADADQVAQEGQRDTSSFGLQEMVLGDENAPITMIEYASYTCPHCRNFHQGMFKNIKADYIDTGKVKFIYREVYFDRFGLWASILARCGGEDKFFAITDALYAQQSNWGNGSAEEVAAKIARLGVAAGLNRAQVDACFADGDTAKALVEWYEYNRDMDEVNSTPTFFVNGERTQNFRNYADFRAVLDTQ